MCFGPLLPLPTWVAWEIVACGCDRKMNSVKVDLQRPALRSLPRLRTAFTLHNPSLALQGKYDNNLHIPAQQGQLLRN
jgi:hypothetical protein